MSQIEFKHLYNEFNIKFQNKEYKEALELTYDLFDLAQGIELEVAYTLMAKARVLTALNRQKEALITYEELIEKFDKTTDILILNLLAYSYYNKALIYAQKKKNIKKS